MPDREAHIAALRDLLAAPSRADDASPDEGLADDEREGFESMLASLAAGQRELTRKQWEWAEARHQRLALGDPAERNRGVPRGKEVELVAHKLGLPKRPPRRITK